MVDRNARETKLSLKREWAKGIVAAAVALAAIGLGKAFGKIDNSSTHAKLIGWAAAVVLLIAGTYAIRHIARALGRGLARRSNIGAGATLRLVVTGVGAVILLFALFAVLGVSLSHLLIGAGLAGVILGIAAQQSLSNIFASIVLLFARPFSVGEDIRIRSGVVGVIDVKVMGIGLTYVTVRTDEGVLKIPNSVMLGSAIGRPHPPALTHTDTTPTVPPASSSEKQQ
jgi:small-conductance mechanosensitive channel